jgi:probable addiction module antidote protein
MLNQGIDPKIFRDNPHAVSAYLSEAFEKNDFETLLAAINFVMRAQNVKALAKEAGLRRERLYKTFGGKADPMLSRVMALFEALGVRLTVIPLPPRKIPPRPKLGRPKKQTKEH